MTFKVTLAVVTQSIKVPASAPAAGQYQAKILDADSNPVQAQVQDAPAFTFTGVPAGSYTATVARLDVNGAVIDGSTATASFSTGPDSVPTEPEDVDVDVPATLSVTVEQE